MEAIVVVVGTTLLVVAAEVFITAGAVVTGDLVVVSKVIL